LHCAFDTYLIVPASGASDEASRILDPLNSTLCSSVRKITILNSTVQSPVWLS